MRVATQYASAPCKLTISSNFFARWHLFRHVSYLRHQQQVDLWPFDLESGVRVTCDVGYLCANFSLLGLSVLELGPMYATDRQTDVRQKHRLMPPPYGGGGIIMRSCLVSAQILAVLGLMMLVTDWHSMFALLPVEIGRRRVLWMRFYRLMRLSVSTWLFCGFC